MFQFDAPYILSTLQNAGVGNGALVAAADTRQAGETSGPAGQNEQGKVSYQCVRWAWTGDVYERKVYCLQWKKVEKK